MPYTDLRLGPIPLIPFSIPVIEHHLHIAVYEHVLIVYKSVVLKLFPIRNRPLIYDVVNSRTTSWKCKISVGYIESNMMKNKEIEAWVEGVIIGLGMTQFVNEARADDATRPAVGRYGI